MKRIAGLVVVLMVAVMMAFVVGPVMAQEKAPENKAIDLKAKVAEAQGTLDNLTAFAAQKAQTAYTANLEVRVLNEIEIPRAQKALKDAQDAEKAYLEGQKAATDKKPKK
jgi:predicted secreted protein